MSNATPDELKKAEPIHYTWGGSQYEAKVDPARCRASVAERGRGGRVYQCRAKAKLPTLPGGPPEWCTAHEPARILVKARAASAKHDRETRIHSLGWEADRLARECADALCLTLDIGAHEQARQLAYQRRDVLAELAALRKGA
jgi:hypothetical protein